MDRMTLRRGPVGDPTSADPFERAQAQAPWGWHVEGQMFRLTDWTWLMMATGPDAQGHPVSARAEGTTEVEVAEALVREMQLATDVSVTSRHA